MNGWEKFYLLGRTIARDLELRTRELQNEIDRLEREFDCCELINHAPAADTLRWYYALKRKLEDLK